MRQRCILVGLAALTLALNSSAFAAQGKGGGKGNGGGGGGGGGGDTPTGDPVIAATIDGYYQRGGDLAVLDADGSNMTVILDAAQGVAYENPSWDPTGEWLVFTEGATNSSLVDRTIQVIKKDGSERYEVWTPDVTGYGAASWSPDGNWIAYSAWDPGDDSTIVDDVSKLYLIPVVSIEEGGFGPPHTISSSLTDPSLTNSSKTVKMYPSWSHLGNRIAVASTLPENWFSDLRDIVVFDIEFSDSDLCDLSHGQSAVPCISAEQNVSVSFSLPSYMPSAVWAKQHDWLAIGAGGYEGIYIVDLEGSCGASTGRVADGGSVSWSSDDTHLVFGSREGRKFGLYSQEVWVDGLGSDCPDEDNDRVVIKSNTRFLAVDWMRP